MTCGDDTLVIGTHNGMAIHFRETDVRPMGRVTHGVRGIHLGGGDYVVGMARAVAGATLLSVTERGFGKRTALTEYKIQTRGGQGPAQLCAEPEDGQGRRHPRRGCGGRYYADFLRRDHYPHAARHDTPDRPFHTGRTADAAAADVSIVNFAVTERAAEEPEQADADEGAQAPAAAEEQA